MDLSKNGDLLKLNISSKFLLRVLSRTIRSLVTSVWQAWVRFNTCVFFLWPNFIFNLLTIYRS